MVVRLLVAFASACVASAANGQIVVKGDPAKAQQLVTQVCAACHGADGNSAIPANPVLAAQHPEYAFKQLSNFKAEPGKTADRPSPVMTAIVANLSRDDMANAALYFSGQEAKPRAARNPELVKLGQAIYRGGIAGKGVAACASCHAANGVGIPVQFPRVAGQHAQYTSDQLKAFRSGARANDPNRMMRTVALKLTDREIDAVAQYIQGLR
jgi:cytochrome c553